LVETEWEGDSELDAREAHEADIAIGFEARAAAVEEFLDHNLALSKGAEGEDSVGDGYEGEDARPHPEKWECKYGIVRGAHTTHALDDDGAVILNDVV